MDANARARPAKRAERRIGELMAEQPKAKGTKGQLVGYAKTRQSNKDTPTLADAGIDKNLADDSPPTKAERRAARQRATARTRRYRQRQKAGVAVYRVEVSAAAIEMLIKLGWLHDRTA